MTTAEWFEYADTHKDKISRLINNFHPVNRQPGRRRETATQKGDFITAPNAEIVCAQVRKQIKDTYEGLPPTDAFFAAIIVKDVKTVAKILNETWFGVPESSNCWYLDGFAEVCSLLENMPDEPDSVVH